MGDNSTYIKIKNVVSVFTSLSDFEDKITNKNKVVLDLRNDANPEMEKIIQHLTNNNELNIIQVWLPLDKPKFREMQSRVKKHAKSYTNQLLAKILMLDSNISNQDCFALGEKVIKLYQSFEDLPEILMAHPIHSFEKNGITVKIISNSQKKLIQQNRTELASKLAIISQNGSTSKSPSRRTFSAIKRFKMEADQVLNLTTNADDMAKSNKNIRHKCYMCNMKTEMLCGTLCDKCFNLNKSMRNEKVDLSGKYAIVTGHSSKFSKRNYIFPLHSQKLVTYLARFPQISLFCLSERCEPERLV